MMVLASPAPPNDFVGLFRTDERARAAYAEGAGIYRIVPEAVALPETVDDLQALVRWATNTGTSLIPRGAGSAVSGNNIGEGVIVDLGRIEPRFLEIDAKLRQARTSPDVTFESLTAAARIHGLRLPPDPASGAFATLGGMVATNAAGARSVRFGPVRPWVRSLDIVTGDGDQCRLERGMPLDLARREAAALERFAREVDPAIRGAADLIRRRFPKTTKTRQPSISIGYFVWFDFDFLDSFRGFKRNGERFRGYLSFCLFNIWITPSHLFLLYFSNN